MVEEFRARRDLDRRRPERDPGHQLPPPAGAFYVFPDDLGHGPRRGRARRAAARRRGRVRPVPARRSAASGADHVRIELRQLAREPAPRRWRGSGASSTLASRAGADRRLRRLGHVGPPRVFVARAHPRRGPRAHREASDADVWEDELPPPRDELLRAVAGCDGVLTLLTDRSTTSSSTPPARSSRSSATSRSGFDNIDVPACTRRGIPVGNTPGVLTETTADLALALLMAAAPARRRGRPLRPRGTLEDVGPDAAAGPRRPRRDARDRRLRADRAGGGAARDAASG